MYSDGRSQAVANRPKATSRNGQSSANYLVLHNHPEQE